MDLSATEEHDDIPETEASATEKTGESIATSSTSTQEVANPNRSFWSSDITAWKVNVSILLLISRRLAAAAAEESLPSSNGVEDSDAEGAKLAFVADNLEVEEEEEPQVDTGLEPGELPDPSRKKTLRMSLTAPLPSLKRKLEDPTGSDAGDSEGTSKRLKLETETSNPLQNPSARQSNKALRSKARRKLTRIRNAQERNVGFYYDPPPSSSKSVSESVIEVLDIQVHSQEDFPGPATSSRRKEMNLETNDGPQTVDTVESLLGQGYILREWDGRKPTLILDSDDQITTVLVGRPWAEDSSWDSAISRCEEVMTSVRKAGLEAGVFNEEHQTHRRGNFVSIPLGVSYSEGRGEPGNYDHPPERYEILKPLLEDPVFRRVVGFQSSALGYYSPKYYIELARHMVALFKKKKLQKTFPNTVFPAVTFDLGPKTVSVEHIHSKNVLYGLSALIALGDFDCDKGGHLILHDLKLLVRFPRGSVILSLSGILRHGITPIGPDETRMEISQHCAGGILGWLRPSGCKSEKEEEKLESSSDCKMEESADEILDSDKRVMECLSRFSTSKSLLQDRRDITKKWKEHLTKPLSEAVL